MIVRGESTIIDYHTPFDQGLRDFPQTKLDNEINVHFLLNEHGDPHFLFYKFNEDNIRNN